MLPLSSQLRDRTMQHSLMLLDIISIFSLIRQHMNTRLVIPSGGFGDRTLPRMEKALGKLKARQPFRAGLGACAQFAKKLKARQTDSCLAFVAF